VVVGGGGSSVVVVEELGGGSSVVVVVEEEEEELGGGSSVVVVVEEVGGSSVVVVVDEEELGGSTWSHVNPSASCGPLAIQPIGASARNKTHKKTRLTLEPLAPDERKHSRQQQRDPDDRQVELPI
jgi:hypothetical protein